MPRVSVIQRIVPWAVAAFCACLYVVVSVNDLTVFPPVTPDEAWIAAGPHKLATQGVLGNDLFTGFHEMDRLELEHVPVYPLLQAAMFRVFGTGLRQMRLLPVASGLALLVAVFIVGRQAGGARLGALAVVLLVALRVGDGHDRGTGILLLDRARLNRYDILVPVFGLLALAAATRATQREQSSWFVFAGALAALSSLTHPIGLMWLVIVLGLALAPHGVAVTRGAVALRVLGGFAITWLPWALVLAINWQLVREQFGSVLMGERFSFFDTAVLAANLSTPGDPLAPRGLLSRIGTLSPAHVGAWTALIGGAGALLTVMAEWITRSSLAGGWRVRKHPETRDARTTRFDAHTPRPRANDGGPLVWAIGLVAHMTAFALLLTYRANYAIDIWPLAILLIAWFGLRSWDAGGAARRAILLLVVTAVIVEAGGRLAWARERAHAMTPYEQLTARVAACVPDGARVLGLQTYWLGLRQFEYRAWTLPFYLAAQGAGGEPKPLGWAIERVDPDVILIDPRMDAMFSESRPPAPAADRWRAQFRAFSDRHPLELLCAFDDATYGAFRVYRVSKATPAAADH